MEKPKEVKDIENPREEFDKLTERFRLLQDRFMAIAMDYKHYINSELSNHEIFKLRDSVLYRFYSARFHFQLLLEHHTRVEHWFQELYKKDPQGFFRDSFEIQAATRQSTKEIYSLFDSMIYHLCSIYDYLFRLVNYAHKNTQVDKPIWNKLFQKKNIEQQLYCSSELLTKLKEIDADFVYPLIGHRSHLIHTQDDTGAFTVTFGLSGEEKFDAKFEATELFHRNFPGMKMNNVETEFTIKYASQWLISKTIQTTTEVLFDLRDDMERNKKIPHGFVVLLDDKKGFIPVSTPKWGDRNVN